MKNHLIFFLIIIFSFFLGLNAQDTTLVFDRPGISDSPYLTKKGNMLFENGFSLDRFRISQFSNPPSILLRNGISSFSELRFSFCSIPQSYELNCLFENTVNRVFTLGYKHKLLKEDKLLPETAIMVNYSANYLLQQFKGSTIETYLLLHHNISDKFGFNSNIGFFHITHSASDFLFVSACVNYNFHHRLGAFVESFNYFSGKSGSMENAFDAGITFMINHKIQFDISCIMNQNSAKKFISSYALGFSFQL